MGDPLFANGVNLAVILIVILKAVVVFVVVLVSVLFMVWYERKVISYMQNRVGPEPGRALRPAPVPGRRR